MLVLFDVAVDWERTLADVDKTLTGRTYHAAPPASGKLCIIVLHEAVADAVAMSPRALYGRVADCSIGDHDGAIWSDFCTPEGAGYQHTKISVRALAPGS